MLRYCKKDVHVNHDVYNALIEEYTKIHGKNPMIKEGLRIEHDTAVFNAQVRTVGWKFDLERAGETQGRMLERMNEIEGTIEPQLGDRQIWIDKEERTPKFKKTENIPVQRPNNLLSIMASLLWWLILMCILLVLLLGGIGWSLLH